MESRDSSLLSVNILLGHGFPLPCPDAKGGLAMNFAKEGACRAKAGYPLDQNLSCYAVGNPVSNKHHFLAN